MLSPSRGTDFSPKSPVLAGIAAILRIVGLSSVLHLLTFANVFALDPARHISQYGHTAWRIQDGFLPGAAIAITQTQDGYIWIGTRAGLVRFDGARFVPFTVSTGESLRSPRILSLFSDRDGSLWIGTNSDLEHWKNQQLTHFPETQGQTFGTVMQIFRSHEGSIWLARARVSDDLGPICSLQSGSLKCFNGNDGVPAAYLAGALEDKDGSFWLHDDSSLFHWDPKSRRLLPGGMTQAGAVDRLQRIVLDRDGSVLIASAQLGSHTGLARVRNGQLEPYKAGAFDGERISAQVILIDSKGSLWIGTDNDGLYRVNGEQVSHYAMADGLSDDTVNGFFEDREGNIWVATSQGIDRFRDIPVVTYSAREGLSSDSVAAVLAASDGTVWINNLRSLDALQPDGRVTSYHLGAELSGHAITCLMEDRKRRLWVGIDSGLQIFDHRTFKKVQISADRPAGPIQALAEDQAGDVWAISADPKPHGSLLHFANDAFKEEIAFDQLPIAKAVAIAADPHDGIWLPLFRGDVAHWRQGRAQIFALHRTANTGYITGLLALPDGFVISSSTLGLAVIRDGRIRELSVQQGLPCARIWTMTATDEALWLYSECGAIELRLSELERWWTHPAVRPDMTILDALDGAQPASAGYFPRSSHSPDGRVWFANSSVLQMIDPHAPSSPVPPVPVLVEQLQADGKTYSLSKEIVLPALTRDLQFDYTSPRFAIPQRVHFRYKLEGLDEKWVESGTRRQAFFTNLRPGIYQFHVSAAAGDSPWGAESAITFRVPPMFYQTTWFTFVCLALTLLVLLILFRLRIEAAKRKLQAKLQVRMDERERIARDLHDTLFQNVQGLFLLIDNSTNTLPEGHPTRGALKEALHRSDQVMADSRERVLELRAERVNRQPVGQALTEAGIELSRKYPIAFRAVVLGTPEDLHPVVFEEVFHVCREALLNAFRHSGAKQVEMEILYTRDTFSVRITDDGVGIDERVLTEQGRPGHFGLKGMLERAREIGAKFTIRSKPAAGTVIELSIPRTVAYGTRPRIWEWLAALGSR